MTVKEYNTEVYPKINNARSFLHSLDHALFKAGEDAQEQVRIIGWDYELQQFICEAVGYYAEHLRSQIE